MTLPNFLIIGAQKSGTSYLGRQLAQHPEIYCHPEEIHFFDKDYNFSKGMDWYESHFSLADGARAVGEKTPDYMWANGIGTEGHLPDVHRNLHQALPGAKLIAILRNPVDRAVSAAWHIIRSGRVSPLLTLDELLVGKKKELMARHGVIEYGHYAELLNAYYELFDPGQILILIFEEDIVGDPALGLKKACDFLGADSDFDFSETTTRINEGRGSLPALTLNYYLPVFKRLNSRIDRFFTTYVPHASSETLDDLYQHYALHNEALFTLLGREIPSWKR